ncbi:MAG: hypothetical protein AMK69_24775 [Nitrospira bacterium SG8_3]|nr:MAG: hypothetical protein AMK69_24775 [Nitrospira bacterium SG8_3]
MQDVHELRDAHLFVQPCLVPTSTPGLDLSGRTKLAAAFLVCFGHTLQESLKPTLFVAVLRLT